MRLFLVLSIISVGIINNISATSNNNLFNIYSDSLTLCLNLPSELAPGEHCTDIVVLNYSDVQSLQFAIDYDVSKIEWKSAEDFNETAKITIFDTNLAAPGNFRVSWSHPAGQSSFLEDEQVLFSICYEVLETAASSDIYLSSSISGGSEATNNEGIPIPMTFNCNILNNTYAATDNLSRVFPNPASHVLNLEIQGKLSGIIEVFDVTGQKRSSFPSELFSPGTIEVPILSLSPGSYFVQLRIDGLIQSFPFLKI